MEIFGLIFYGVHLLGFIIGCYLVEGGLLDGSYTFYFALWAAYIIFNFL
jgi:hypothetical protein